MTVLVISPAALAASACPPTGSAAGRTARTDCPPPPAKLEPYDPDRMRAGSRPGFVDLGNGTQVRIGGRVRTEFETTR